jgi:hypothetical protein
MRNVIILAISSAALFAVAASATTTIPKERVCPVGGEKYASFEIGSTSYWGIRLDLQRTGIGAYLPYVECPNGFVVYRDEAEFTAEEIAKLTPVVASAEYKALRESAPPVRIVMLEGALGKSDADLRHWLFRASFETEREQADPSHRKYLTRATDAYGEWLKVHAEHDEEWWFCAVRHADLLRQSGRFAESAFAAKELRAAQPPKDTVLPQVIDQIEQKAAAGDSAPAQAEDKRS